ncbi:uncharacterized protein LOC111032216 isoform X2 [Myzus persicae]|uniref:uncharacterized protein LOC111032216 isoform X2 n=1 Tax=Myzus persicae TaxID=13164 RepID=UPI000B93409F|nr:uncharacterized protein LOC111032216 isoform X2 [Myzus persicae]
MDLYTESKLKEWGFSTEIIEVFKDEEINEMALLSLTETMITQLFPKIGQRSVFLKKLGELKDLKNLSVQKIELQPKHPAIDWDNLEFEVTDTDNILLPFDGNVVEEEISLNDSALVSSNTSITKKHNEYSSGIEELFPTESWETYFIPYLKVGDKITPNRGKLYDKYCHLKKEIKRITPNKKRNHSEIVENNTNFVEHDFEDSINWLKNNIQPETTLVKLWKETSNFRLNQSLNNIKLFPGLTKPTGYLLIEIDFIQLFPTKEMGLLNKFECFKEHLKKMLKIKKPYLGSQEESLLQQLFTPVKLGDDDLAAFSILPRLFQPVSTVITKINGSSSTRTTHKPSKLEQEAAFIVNIINVNELKSLNSAKIERAFSLGLTVQPYVVIVGSSTTPEIAYYAVIEDTYFKLETVIKAFDVCFKSFHTLNLEYPVEAKQVWTFFQIYFYGIQAASKSDQQFVSVKSLLKDINN